MQEIANRFETQTGHKVDLIFGSTGKHYAQIVHGAPFDLFFAADRERPERLEKEGRAIAGSRFTYAFGRLALYSAQADRVDREGHVLASHVLASGAFRRLALANPELAPFGRAAQQTLVSLELWKQLSGRLVRGENVGQTFQFVESGNAELGFVSLSQIWSYDETRRGSWWEVPRELYEPIEQQAVRLVASDAAEQFCRFLQEPETIARIEQLGYGRP